MAATLLRAERLFDGDRPLTDAAVLVDRGRVVWAGKASRAPAAARGAVEASAPTGTTLVPGLINCHVHLALSGAADFTKDAGADVPTQTLRATVNALRSVVAGVTTVRDLGAPSTAPIEVGRAVARGELVGPNVVAAGRAICATGGHAWELGREADGPDDMRRAVREQLRDGASAIKLVATGAVLGAGGAPDVAELDRDELRAAVEAAHVHRLRVAAHAHATVGIRVALEAGVDTVEHATLLDRATIRLCREKGAALVPTFSALDAIVANAERLTPEVAPRGRALVERHRTGMRDALRAGVTIAAGTDAGTPFNYVEDFAHEIEALAAIGMSAEQALRAATSVAATVIGRDDVGRIAAGARADLVAITGDPLRDPTACRAVAAVWKDGIRIAGTSAGARRP